MCFFVSLILHTIISHNLSCECFLAGHHINFGQWLLVMLVCAKLNTEVQTFAYLLVKQPRSQYIQALLIYDGGGLMPRQWIVALLWLTSWCIILSCITVHCRLAGRTYSIGLVLYIPKIHVCVSVRLCACGSVAVIQFWRSSRYMLHSTGNLTERSRPNLHDRARAEKQKGRNKSET